MVAKKLADLLVYQKAITAANAVSALLKRSAFSKDYELKSQLANASGRIPGHIAEGYGQLTDQNFARYLGIARGSAQEVRGHLQVAFGRSYVSKTELNETENLYVELAVMLTSLMGYLRRSNRKQRW